MKLIGILLAAGRGRRMGGSKQFHPVATSAGEKPLVAAAFDTISGACDEMMVVLGHRASEVAAALGQRQFQTIESNPDAPMITSVKSGLEAVVSLSRRATPSGNSAILLQLGDHPALLPATLDLLLTTFAANPDKAVMPTFQGNGGHPVVISPAIAERILAQECPGGLRQFWIDHPEFCVRVEVDDASVVRDIDTV